MRTHLHSPLGLVFAPHGDLVATNGDAVNANVNQTNEMVEFTPAGRFVAQVPVDFSGTPGGAFGIALATFGNELRFAAVDDHGNAVNVWAFDPTPVRSVARVVPPKIVSPREAAVRPKLAAVSLIHAHSST
jgi:hypothetical protein